MSPRLLVITENLTDQKSIRQVFHNAASCHRLLVGHINQNSEGAAGAKSLWSYNTIVEYNTVCGASFRCSDGAVVSTGVVSARSPGCDRIGFG